MFNRQTLFDKRLQSIESKLDSLSQGIAGPQDDNEKKLAMLQNHLDLLVFCLSLTLGELLLLLL